MAWRILQMDLLIRSQTQPICDAAGGLNFHVIFLCSQSFSDLSPLSPFYFCYVKTVDALRTPS